MSHGLLERRANGGGSFGNRTACWSSEQCGGGSFRNRRARKRRCQLGKTEPRDKSSRCNRRQITGGFCQRCIS